MKKSSAAMKHIQLQVSQCKVEASVTAWTEVIQISQVDSFYFLEVCRWAWYSHKCVSNVHTHWIHKYGFSNRVCIATSYFQFLNSIHTAPYLQPKCYTLLAYLASFLCATMRIIPYVKGKGSIGVQYVIVHCFIVMKAFNTTHTDSLDDKICKSDYIVSRLWYSTG